MNKKIILAFASLSTLLVGCNTPDQPVTPVDDSSHHIFSLDSNVKLQLKEDTSLYDGVNLNIEMCKNEKEGVQLVFTPDKTCMYDLKIGELASDNGVIPEKNITVYREHYVNVTLSRDPGAKTGYYPDPIVPLELSKEYGENIVSKGENQSLYIEVKTEKNTIPGLYEADVELTLGEEKHYYLLSVLVHDVTIPTTHNARRAYAIWESEYDFAYQTLDGSEEYVNNASELLLEYGVSPTQIANINKIDSVSKQVEKIVEYGSREDVTCFALPYVTTQYSVVGHGSYITADFARLKQIIQGMIVNSTNDNDLVKKAYLYITTLDEQKIENYWKVIDTNSRILNIKNELLNNSSIWTTNNDKVKDSLKNLEHVVTLTQSTPLYEEEPQSGLYSACPLYNILDNSDYLYKMQERQEAGNTYWWYGCTTPTTPYPTNHITDNLLAPREVSWMQKYYGINGDLFWCANLTSMYDGVHGTYLARDTWKTGNTDHGAGDGWVMYPGNRYNTLESFPSIRLVALRDGIEDYDLLCMLENAYNKAKEKYNFAFNFSDMVNDIYSQIFNGVYHIDNVQAFRQARKQLIGMIEAINSDANVVSFVEKNLKTNHSTISLYAKEGTSIKVNGQEVANKGNLFEANIKSVDNSVINVTISSSNKEINFERYVFGYAEMMENFDNGIDGVTLTKYQGEGIEKYVNTLPKYSRSGSSLKLSLEHVDRESYKPRARVTISDEKPRDCSNFTNFVCNIYNDSNEAISLTISLSDDSGTIENIAPIVLKPNAWNDVNKLLVIQGLDVSKLIEVRFTFNNSTTNRDVYIDNIAFIGGNK